MNEDSVCDACMDEWYGYCDQCDGYYHHEDAGNHAHDYEDDGCCDSAQKSFTVRNDGEDDLPNDTRAEVTLPAGLISEQGIREIRHYLINEGFADLAHYGVPDLGNEWQTATGNFPKRLSRLAYQRYQQKVTPQVMSHVGTIARNHSTAVSVSIEFTRQLNLPASAFYHEDSCWWSCYSESRCVFKTNGGFGIRSFRDTGEVSGRAWVLPLKKVNGNLMPTYDTHAEMFVVFNGYGALSGYAPARMLAHMTGMTYRKCDFGADPMYVNSGGYLVAPEHLVKQHGDGIYLSLRRHSDLSTQEGV
jgi:hypothetical protein